MYITEYKCKFDAADIAILNGLEQGFFCLLHFHRISN